MRSDAGDRGLHPKRPEACNDLDEVVRRRGLNDGKWLNDEND